MKQPYLEITFRRGKPLAAYLYLPRPPGARSARTVEARPSVLVDFAADGAPIGVEILAPREVDATVINGVLAEFGLAPLPTADFAPLRAA